jgi:putative transposase
VLVQKRRDKDAAKRFFRRVLRSNPVPRKIVSDQLRSYPAAKADIPELAHVKHVFVKAAARVNNCAEHVTNRPAGANARCADFAMRVARRHFSHPSARSDSTSRCLDIR